MYSWEIKKFIEERDYYIGGDDLLKVISPKENPQLTRIKYTPYTGEYYLKDNENNEFTFTAMPYEEACAKKLVKTNKIN